MKFGKIHSFSPVKKIGYIISDSDHSIIFFRKFDTDKPVKINDKVLYEEGENEKGKIALKIKVFGSDSEPEQRVATKQINKKGFDSKAVIKSISDNWKLEAKLETPKNYFYHLEKQIKS
jgi:hypothetical protein